MAPRTISKMSYNPLHFKSLKHKHAFDDIHSKLKVCIGRPVKFSDFSNYRIQEYLHFQTWDHLLIDVDPVYPFLVQLFYTHLDFSDDRRTISSYVKGVNIELTPQIIFEIFHLPLDGYDVYYSSLESHQYPEGQNKFIASTLIHGSPTPSLVTNNRVKNLCPEAYLLAKLLFDSFIPKGGDTDYVRGCTSLVIYFLMSQQRVNLPFLMMDCICDISNARRNLPYGSFFTKIFSHFGVDLTNEQTTPPQSHFGKRVITNMIKTLGITAAEEEVAEEVAEEEEEETEEEGEDQGTLLDRLNELDEKISVGFKRMDSRFNEVQTSHQEIKSQLNEVRSTQQELNSKMDSIIQHFNIPPRRRPRRGD